MVFFNQYLILCSYSIRHSLTIIDLREKEIKRDWWAKQEWPTGQGTRQIVWAVKNPGQPTQDDHGSFKIRIQYGLTIIYTNTFTIHSLLGHTPQTNTICLYIYKYTSHSTYGLSLITCLLFNSILSKWSCRSGHCYTLLRIYYIIIANKSYVTYFLFSSSFRSFPLLVTSSLR